MEIPIELFLGGIAVSIAIGIFGFIRNPQVPAMLCFGGAFVLLLSVSTNQIQLEAFTDGPIDNIEVYPQRSSSGVADICGAGGVGCNDIRGEYVSSTSSQLLGDTIDCIDVPLRKSGAPTGNGEVGVWDGNQATNNPIIISFGTFDASVLTTTNSVWTTFCLPLGQTYTITNQNVIGVRYDGGTATDTVRVLVSGADVFDGTITMLRSKSDATNTWATSSTQDLTAVFYLRGEESTILNNTFEFTELPKTFFALIGGSMILLGALMVIKE